MGGPAVAVVTTRQLLEAGMHFGHQTRRWNPKMRRFILGERNGIYIIDLKKTLAGLEEAYGYVRDLVAKGGILLFVGTKKQTQGPIATYARACGMPLSTSGGWAGCSPTSPPSRHAWARCVSTRPWSGPATSRPCPRRKACATVVSWRSSGATSVESGTSTASPTPSS